MNTHTQPANNPSATTPFDAGAPVTRQTVHNTTPRVPIVGVHAEQKVSNEELREQAAILRAGIWGVVLATAAVLLGSLYLSVTQLLG